MQFICGGKASNMDKLLLIWWKTFVIHFQLLIDKCSNKLTSLYATAKELKTTH